MKGDHLHYMTESDRLLLNEMFAARYKIKTTKKDPPMPITDGKIDLSTMQTYVDQKLVSKKTWQSHGGGLLYLFNYTAKCSYEKEWNSYTMAARGLVTDTQGNIILHPFEKFFNVEEEKSPIPTGHVEVYEKVDGSMITVGWTHTDGLIVASRGSFESEQAQHARELIVNTYGQEWIIPNLTYIFEVIYPQNRIVVNYGNADELVLLGVQNNKGEGWSYSSMLNADFPFRVAEQVATFPGYKEFLSADLKSTIKPNSEGYVLRFKDEFRLKLKGDEYLRLHRIVTNTNNKTVWEMCKDDRSFEELITHVPDEFMWWIKKKQNEFKEKYHELELLHMREFDKIRERPRPQFAAAVHDAERNNPRILSAVLYRIKDEKPYDDLLWKVLKPTELERPPVGETDEL